MNCSVWAECVRVVCLVNVYNSTPKTGRGEQSFHFGYAFRMRSRGVGLTLMALVDAGWCDRRRPLSDSNGDDALNLTSLLPLWAPLTRWESANGPAYRDLWRQLPQVPGVYRHPLTARAEAGHHSSAGKADCNTMAAVPLNATAVVWSGIGVALRHFAAHAGCEGLLDSLEQRLTVVAFEPIFNGPHVKSTASCPRVQSPPSGGHAYLTIPYPTQFHARSDASIADHLSSITSVSRPYLVAYFASSHGRQKELRAILHQACQESHDRCIRIDFAEGGCDPRHQSGRCTNETQGFDASETNIFERILRGYLKSEFCLMPGGDTPTRQGLMDALLVGCIPVVFATCTQRLLYDEAYHPFIPRFERAGWGAGNWSVLLDSDRILKKPGLLMADLEAISKEQRKAMRDQIATFIPQLQYSAPGVTLHEYTDAQRVYERVVARLQPLHN